MCNRCCQYGGVATAGLQACAESCAGLPLQTVQMLNNAEPKGWHNALNNQTGSSWTRRTVTTPSGLHVRSMCTCRHSCEHCTHLPPATEHW